VVYREGNLFNNKSLVNLLPYGLFGLQRITLSSTISQQGQKLTDSTVCMVDASLTLSSLNDNHLKPTLSLYACALDDGPEHVDDPRVIETCRARLIWRVSA
jgi:hypothetical protein